jgi:virulence-associated protein VapD
MALWAIAYDLDVRGMKAAGYTKGKVTSFYSSIRQCLQSNQFEKQTQWSIYSSAKDNSLTNAFQACVAMQRVVDADKYIKRLHLFRIEDLNDLLPLVVSGKTSAGRDPIEEEIDAVYDKELVAAAE